MAKITVSGVYAIRNTVNGRVYVGSSQDVRSRWNQHKHQLRNGTHHSIVLQRSWNKHGEAAFAFSVVELVVSSNDLFKREQHWIDELYAACGVRGFNRYPTAGGPRGFKVSPQTRALMSANRRGRKLGPFSAEHRAAISAAKKGQKHSPETRLKWSTIRRGKKRAPFSLEHKAAISMAMAGRPRLLSPEHVAKLTVRVTALNKSPEARARTATRNRLGLGGESKAKISRSWTAERKAALAARNQTPEARARTAALNKTAEARARTVRMNRARGAGGRQMTL